MFLFCLSTAYISSTYVSSVSDLRISMSGMLFAQVW